MPVNPQSVPPPRVASAPEWSTTPTADPLTILEGDAYETRDVGCARCGAKFRAAPWPRENQNLTCRPRCGRCGSVWTYPLETP